MRLFPRINCAVVAFSNGVGSNPIHRHPSSTPWHLPPTSIPLRSTVTITTPSFVSPVLFHLFISTANAFSSPLPLELRRENDGKQLAVCSYVELIQDALHLNRSVCLARNFHLLHKDEIESGKRKVFVDIWLVRSTANETTNHVVLVTDHFRRISFSRKRPIDST